MSRVIKGLIYILRYIDRFASAVIGIELRQYQTEPLLEIVDSIKRERGLDFLLVFPRQSGKNEAAAILIVYLLNLLQRRDGQIVFGAIGDGIGRMIERVETRLDNKWNINSWTKHSRPARRKLGKQSVVFISSHPQAATRGETASTLLIIDELQDQSRAHLEAVFEPMRAAANATAVYLGTVRTDYDALWKKKSELEELQERDGQQRVFMVHPDRVARANPAYGAFLKSKVARFGRNHPIIASEYYLEPLGESDRLLPRRRLQLLTGTHERSTEPDPTKTYVALIDIGGQDEAATSINAELQNTARDHTTVTIVEISAEKPHVYTAVDIFTDVGSRHFQEFPGKTALSERILSFLEHWCVIHTVIDGTGVGEGLSDWLAQELGAANVSIFKFSQRSKAALGSTLLALIETRRLKYFTERDETGQIAPESDAWWFFIQAAACRYTLAPGAAFDAALRWSVPETHTTDTADGAVRTHDDRLLSLALIAVIDEMIKTGDLRTGTAKSAIIAAIDPLEGLIDE